jgi:hypothetical protein
MLEELGVRLAALKVPVVSAEAFSNEAGHRSALKRWLPLVLSFQANLLADVFAPLRDARVKGLLERIALLANILATQVSL